MKCTESWDCAQHHTIQASSEPTLDSTWNDVTLYLETCWCKKKSEALSKLGHEAIWQGSPMIWSYQGNHG